MTSNIQGAADNTNKRPSIAAPTPDAYTQAHSRLDALSLSVGGGIHLQAFAHGKHEGCRSPTPSGLSLSKLEPSHPALLEPRQNYLGPLQDELESLLAQRRYELPMTDAKGQTLTFSDVYDKYMARLNMVPLGQNGTKGEDHLLGRFLKLAGVERFVVSGSGVKHPTQVPECSDLDLRIVQTKLDLSGIQGAMDRMNLQSLSNVDEVRLQPGAQMCLVKPALNLRAPNSRKLDIAVVELDAARTHALCLWDELSASPILAIDLVDKTLSKQAPVSEWCLNLMAEEGLILYNPNLCSIYRVEKQLNCQKTGRTDQYLLLPEQVACIFKRTQSLQEKTQFLLGILCGNIPLAPGKLDELYVLIEKKLRRDYPDISISREEIWRRANDWVPHAVAASWFDRFLTHAFSPVPIEVIIRLLDALIAREMHDYSETLLKCVLVHCARRYLYAADQGLSEHFGSLRQQLRALNCAVPDSPPPARPLTALFEGLPPAQHPQDDPWSLKRSSDRETQETLESEGPSEVPTAQDQSMSSEPSLAMQVLDGLDALNGERFDDAQLDQVRDLIDTLLPQEITAFKSKKKNRKKTFGQTLTKIGDSDLHLIKTTGGHLIGRVEYASEFVFPAILICEKFVVVSAFMPGMSAHAGAKEYHIPKQSRVYVRQRTAQDEAAGHTFRARELMTLDHQQLQWLAMPDYLDQRKTCDRIDQLIALCVDEQCVTDEHLGKLINLWVGQLGPLQETSRPYKVEVEAALCEQVNAIFKPELMTVTQAELVWSHVIVLMNPQDLSAQQTNIPDAQIYFPLMRGLSMLIEAYANDSHQPPDDRSRFYDEKREQMDALIATFRQRHEFFMYQIANQREATTFFGQRFEIDVTSPPLPPGLEVTASLSKGEGYQILFKYRMTPDREIAYAMPDMSAVEKAFPEQLSMEMWRNSMQDFVGGVTFVSKGVLITTDHLKNVAYSYPCGAMLFTNHQVPDKCLFLMSNDLPELLTGAYSKLLTGQQSLQFEGTVVSDIDYTDDTAPERILEGLMTGYVSLYASESEEFIQVHLIEGMIMQTIVVHEVDVSQATAPDDMQAQRNLVLKNSISRPWNQYQLDGIEADELPEQFSFSSLLHPAYEQEFVNSQLVLSAPDAEQPQGSGIISFMTQTSAGPALGKLYAVFAAQGMQATLVLNNVCVRLEIDRANSGFSFRQAIKRLDASEFRDISVAPEKQREVAQKFFAKYFEVSSPLFNLLLNGRMSAPRFDS